MAESSLARVGRVLIAKTSLAESSLARWGACPGTRLPRHGHRRRSSEARTTPTEMQRTALLGTLCDAAEQASRRDCQERQHGIHLRDGSTTPTRRLQPKRDSIYRPAFSRAGSASRETAFRCELTRKLCRAADEPAQRRNAAGEVSKRFRALLQLLECPPLDRTAT